MQKQGAGRQKRGKTTNNDTNQVNYDFTVKCPRHLNAAGRRMWNTVISEVGHVLQNKDCFALEDLCLTYQDILGLTKDLKVGKTVEKKSDRGAVNIALRPEVRLLKEAKTQFKNMLKEFGLTPKSGMGMPRARKKGGTGGSSLREDYS